MPINYESELFKSGLSLLVALSSLGATWVIGQRLTAYWNLRQKRNEINLATFQAFHALYGEFKELVKVWRLMTKSLDVPVDIPKEERWDLLKRACALESKSEALVLRLSTERHLKEEQLELLGLFRQAMQTIRESLRDNVECPLGSRHAEYRLLNQLAPAVAALIMADLPKDLPSPKVAKAQLACIVGVTAKRWKETIKNVDSAPTPESDDDA